MSDLYPEAPHLSAFVASGLDSPAALLASWQVLLAADCNFTGDVLVARDREWFRDVSDVEREVVRYSGVPRDLLVNRDPLRIQFRHRTLGVVALGQASAIDFGEPHPVEVAIHAGPLSLPVELWSRQDRQAAKRILVWMERLLLTLSQPTEARYGAIGIEAGFPTPGALGAAIQRSALRPTTWFWPSQLSQEAASDEADLLASLSQAAVTRSPQGTLFRAWRPGSDPGVDEKGIDRVVGFLSRTVGSSR